MSAQPAALEITLPRPRDGKRPLPKAMPSIEVLPPSTALALKMSVPSSLTDIIRDRHDLSDEELSNALQAHIHGALTTLKACLPLVAEMKRRFKNLDRKQKVDGTHPAICGCHSYKEYCEKVLNRTDRAVRYALNGGNPQNKKKAEIISAPKMSGDWQKDIETLEPLVARRFPTQPCRNCDESNTYKIWDAKGGW